MSSAVMRVLAPSELQAVSGGNYEFNEPVDDGVYVYGMFVGDYVGDGIYQYRVWCWNGVNSPYLWEINYFVGGMLGFWGPYGGGS